ncbi:hypothetical protein ACLEPN_15160 [Myxococcus sp. 1LA]
MTAQASKKLSLKRETLRVLEGSDMSMLAGAVGGGTTLIGTTSLLTVTIVKTVAGADDGN